MTNGNEPIHPLKAKMMVMSDSRIWNNGLPNEFSTNSNVIEDVEYNGLTKREYFAAIVMQGLVSNSKHRQEYNGESYLMSSEIYAEQAVSLADALIEQLKKTSL